jgi:hypothetical protein
MKKRIAIDINDVCRKYSENLIYYYNKYVDKDPEWNPDKIKYLKDGDMYSCIPFKNDKERIDFITSNYVFELNAATKPVDTYFSGKFSLWLKDMEDEFEDDVEILVVSPFERDLEIQSTFFFLSKACIRVKKVLFPQSLEELWDNADVLITANPKLMTDVPKDKTIIKIKTKYNKKSKSKYTYDSIMDVIAEENHEKIKSIILK